MLGKSEEMDRSELEEEEMVYTLSYDHTAFSHIDERIQRVLGHHRKHFEGAPFAKSLSVRFGRYGSFLPAYSSLQEISRDIWSHSTSRSFPTVPSGAATGSFTGLLIEPLPKRPRLASSTDHLKSSSKTFLEDNFVKIYMPRKDSVEKPSGRHAKTLLAERNAEIHRSLGLDNSSSSSEGSSPECKQNFMESREMPIKSPSFIIERMTSFPISEDSILSPLHDSLSCVIKKKNVLNTNASGSILESPVTLMDEFISTREMRDRNMLSTEEKCGMLGEVRPDSYESTSRLINSKRNVAIQKSACGPEPQDMCRRLIGTENKNHEDPERNWICCDDCQKWRLLPRGTNRKSLPQKWLCSMLDWLPGKNKCSFSEEETTEALYTSFQCPPPDTQNKHHGDFDGPEMLHHNQISEDFSLTSKFGSGKSEHRIELFADEGEHGGSAKILQPVEDDQQPNVQNRGFKNEKESSMNCSFGKCDASEAEQPCRTATSGSPLKGYREKVGACLMSSPRKCSKGKDAGVSDRSETEANKRLSGDNCEHSVLLSKNLELEISPSTKEKSSISSFASGTGRVSGWDVRYMVKNQETYKAEHESLNWAHSERKFQYSNSSRGYYGVKLETFDDSVDRRALRSHQYCDYSRTYKYGRNENRSSRTYDTSWRYQHHKRRSSNWFPRNQVHRTEPDTRRGNSRYSRQYRDYHQGASGSRRPFTPNDNESRPRHVNISDKHLKEKSSRAETDVCWTKSSRESYRNSRDSVHTHNDMKVPSPNKNESFCHEANNAFEEAEDLKHSASSLKVSGLRLESTELFFQAALKYLRGASLLEPRRSEYGKLVAMKSVKIYETTAKLLEYCAQEYESCKDMACAALAYKCVEAINMQRIYSTNSIASRDCQELEVAFQSAPSESSSTFSANNEGFSNQLGGDCVLNSRSHSQLVQLVNFAQHASSAMEASAKSQIAFKAASRILEETGSTEVVACIKRALNYSFHNMEELLNLVYKAMEAISG